MEFLNGTPQFILAFFTVGTFLVSVIILIVLVAIHKMIKSFLRPFLRWLFC